jgi:hypothetical protein
MPRVKPGEYIDDIGMMSVPIYLQANDADVGDPDFKLGFTIGFYFEVIRFLPESFIRDKERDDVHYENIAKASDELWKLLQERYPGADFNSTGDIDMGVTAEWYGEYEGDEDTDAVVERITGPGSDFNKLYNEAVIFFHLRDALAERLGIDLDEMYKETA